jgi:O-antigen ligase
LTLKSKILLAALIAAAASLPLKNQWNSIATIFFVVAVAIQQPALVAWQRLKASKFWIVPVLYFVWLAFSHFWDVSGGYRLRDIERYLVLFFIPTAMAVAPDEINKHIRKACMAFVTVTVAVCLFCLAKAYMDYQVRHDPFIFFYQYLSEFADLNAIFLSNFCLASIVWLLYFTFLSGENRRRHYLLVSLIIAFLLMMIFLLSSKLLIFLTLIILMVFVLALGYKKGFLLRAAIVIGLIAGAAVFAVSQLPYLKWRVASTELKKYQGEADNQNGVAIRLYMWQTVAGLIKERPLLGYGIHGGRLTTLAKYKNDGFEMGVTGDYHAHNQFLESILMAGVPALVLLLFLLAIPLWSAIRNKNFLLLLIVVHFICQSIIESTFEVQHELVFYIFFTFLFYYHGPRLRNTLL